MNPFPSIRIEGGLLGPEVLDQLLDAKLQGQKPSDFGLDHKRPLTDEIAAVFADARSLWGVFQHRLGRLAPDDLATTVTRDAWVIPFLGLLGFEPRYNPKAWEVDGQTFAISHRAGEDMESPPVHIVGARQELGRIAASGRPRLSPHALVQEYLNHTEHVWGLVTNGLTLRLLRDCTFVRRQAYVEFDLSAIFEEQRYQDFAVLYRLIHRTRLPRSQADVDSSLLERYYQLSVEQGGRVREHLREGVEDCIRLLANGFLRHTGNEDLRCRFSPGAAGNDHITAGDLYRQLLRLIYRFLFLLVSEDRGLLSPDPIYREHYGISRLRRLLDSRAAYTDHDDLWQSLRVLWKAFADEKLAAYLSLAPLNGELFSWQDLDACTISNADLLEAFWHLAYYREAAASQPRRVNYGALDVEELGSVYESLLELHPHIQSNGQIVQFELIEEGGERRTTGSHYTPPELVSPLIKHTLEPLLGERLATATTQEQKAAAILSIKICDIACGSGHFLLAAARRLGKELARIRTGEDEPAPEFNREATRDVIAHCIYGVDKNPLAVDLCRVALWLESHTGGKPLTFLDHRIRCGDSLVGLNTLDTLANGIPNEAYQPSAGDDKVLVREAKRRNAGEREATLFKGSFMEALRSLAEPLNNLEKIPENTLEQVRQKTESCQRIEHSNEFERLRLSADIWTSAFFQNYTNGRESILSTQLLFDALSSGSVNNVRLAGLVMQSSAVGRYLHWPLAFPEVFSNGGFDIIIGNPPFMGGLKISGAFGDRYRKWLEFVFAPFSGKADLCAAFFRQAFRLLQPGGYIGLVATNTIGQGDSRECGLAVILQNMGVIRFAKRYVKWPGQASVEINLIGLFKSKSADSKNIAGTTILDDQTVSFISSRLDSETEIQPFHLHQNEGKAFQGNIILGMGFVLGTDESERLIAKDPKNKKCLFPYLNGEDINSHYAQLPSRWVIQFDERDETEARQYSDLWKIVKERVWTERKEKDEKRYPRMVNEWWKHWNNRQELYNAIAQLEKVLVRSRVSELHMLAFVPKKYIYSDATVVFAFDDEYIFSILQSNIHEAWVWKNSSSLESRNRYTPTDCFETFPFPRQPNVQVKELAKQVGKKYYEHRQQIMADRNLGLTKTYNLFNDSEYIDEDIVRMRELHAEMDNSVIKCYGWGDVDLDHGFHINARGQTRFSISPVARREVLRRLLELNLEIAANEAGGA